MTHINPPSYPYCPSLRSLTPQSHVPTLLTQHHLFILQIPVLLGLFLGHEYRILRSFQRARSHPPIPTPSQRISSFPLSPHPPTPFGRSHPQWPPSVKQKRYKIRPSPYHQSLQQPILRRSVPPSVSYVPSSRGSKPSLSTPLVLLPTPLPHTIVDIFVMPEAPWRA